MEISEYNETQAGLEKLKGRMQGVIYDVTTKDGMLSAKTDRRELVTLRTSLEAKRKEIKVPALERCKLIDEEAKRVTAEILSLETPIDQQIKAEEARLEAIKLKALEDEKNRVMKIMEAIEKLKAYPVRCSSMKSGELRDTITFIQAMNIVTETFQEFTTQAIEAKAAVIGELVSLCEAAEAIEAEELRIEQARQQAESERLEAERIERERMKQEQERLEAEAEVLRKEKEAFALQQAEAAKVREEEDRKNREAVEAAEAALKAERDKEELRLAEERAELKRQQDAMTETLRKAEEEAARVIEGEAEKQRELDRQAAVIAEEQRKKAEAEKKAADKEKKLALAKLKDSSSALKKILAICEDHEQTDRYRIEQIAIIAEANS